MAPKRSTQPEKAAGSSRAGSKRQKTKTSTEDSVNVPTTPDIDYDKLATAMLKQMSAQQKAALETITVREDTVPSAPVAVSTTSEVSTSTTTPSTSSNRAQSSQSMNSNLHVLDSNQGNPVISLIENLFGNHGSSPTSTLAQETSHRSASTPPKAINLSQDALQLLSAATTERTKTSYLRSWKLLQQFMGSTNITLPLSIQVVGNFVAHLFNNKYSPSSIASHVSALSFVHKILNLEDMTHSFLIRKMLKGCFNMTGKSDTRLPITKEILCKIVDALDFVVDDLKLRILLRTIFLVAFAAFMRLGELICKSHSDAVKVLQRSDVSVSSDSSAPSIKMVLRHFKTQVDNHPVSLQLVSKNVSSRYCPVLAVKQYLKVFTHTAGPFFQMSNGHPVMYTLVSQRLNQALTFAGLDPGLYKGHSFRIGAATEAAKLGYSESVIQRLGRWNSNAVQRYIRINAFQI